MYSPVKNWFVRGEGCNLDARLAGGQDFCRRNQLTGVTCRMLGGMKQKSKDI